MLWQYPWHLMAHFSYPYQFRRRVVGHGRATARSLDCHGTLPAKWQPRRPANVLLYP